MGTRWTPTALTGAPATILLAMALALSLATTACTSTTRAAEAEQVATSEARPAPLAASRPDISPASTAPTTSPAEPTTSPPAEVAATSSATSANASSTTGAVPTSPGGAATDLDLAWTSAAFETLARENTAVSMTVVRDGVAVLRRAAGVTIDGAPATTDSPMVVASVSKLLTGAAVARLAEGELLTLDQPVPWGQFGYAPHPGWNDVTVRELLDHTSGMPVVRSSWFTGEGECWTYLPQLLSEPPRPHRGTWTYSNGNYCALGLLLGATTGKTLDGAVQQLLFDAVGASGLHLTTDGQRPSDVAYQLGVERLSRLGGAGTFVVSTDDLAAVLASITPQDRVALSWPAMMLDQYGWGHTGTVDGARSCAWTLEAGRTVIVSTVAGSSPWTGGALCDLTVPAIAGDLGIGAGPPERTPK